MDLEIGGLRAEFDLRLVEEAVLLATDALPREQRRAFRLERDPIYEERDAARRDAAFRRLHEAWFVRLRLADPVFGLLGEHPGIPGAVSRVLVLPALSAKEEGADLHEVRGRIGSPAPAPQPALLLRVRPRGLVDPGDAAPGLRRDLLHVADMLDPSFGYDQGRRIAGDDGPSKGTLVLGRFRVVWDTSVDGRLQARGRLPRGGEEMRRREFLAAFGRLSPGAGETFRRLFEGPRPTQEEMLAIASAPAGDLMGGIGTAESGAAVPPAAAPPAAVPSGAVAPAAVSPAARAGTSARCPLCRFPTTSFHRRPTELGPGIHALIRMDFPDWAPARGICLQCADLYAARVGEAGRGAETEREGQDVPPGGGLVAPSIGATETG
jgi:hypothetical protein